MPTTPKERLCYRLDPAWQLLVTGLSQPGRCSDSLQPFLEVYCTTSHLSNICTNQAQTADFDGITAI